MQKTNQTTTRTRGKPFRDVSNGVSSSKAVNMIKKLPASQHQSIQKDAASLDRLLLVHSDLSSLLRQTDELVVEALKLDLTSRNGLNELESFTQVLSTIQTSLKPWVPRIQKALSNCSNQSDIEEDSIESPEEFRKESGVSPSPLVSWRGDFGNEGGTQLFLLTPMPKPKSISSKLCPTRRIPSSIISISTNRDDDLLESVGGIIATPNNKASFVVMKTPCLKMSPPKSCVVLEPISELAPLKNNAADRKSTPFPLGINRSFSGYSESSSSDEENDASKNMALKYSELMGGIVQPEKVGNGRKNLDSSPFWFLSPPKTCLVMEPQEDSDSTKPSKSKSVALDLAAAKSIKKHPGENTLKKELWSKFETASDRIHSIRYNPPPSTSQKDFLDRLEEASSCEYS